MLSESGRDDRAVFKGRGLRVQPPSVEKKIFGSVKKHAQRNVSADALYVCTIVSHEKPSGVYKMHETAWAAGAPPRTPLGELTALPQTP